MKIDLTSYIDKSKKNVGEENDILGLMKNNENVSDTRFINAFNYDATKTDKTDTIDVSNFSYGKNGLKNQEEEKSLAENIEKGISNYSDNHKNEMAVIANTVSKEDLKEMQKNGYSINDTDVHTIVTVTDKIKAVMAQAGVDVSKVYGDTLSKEQLEKITGNKALATEIANDLKKKDLPVNTEVVSKSIDAYEKALDLGKLDNSTVSYMVKNGLEPTISNLSMAQSSAGIKKDASETMTESQKEMLNQLSGQIEDFLRNNGFTVNENNVEESKEMVANGISLTKENLAYHKQLLGYETPNEENIISHITESIKDGKNATDAYLLPGFSFSERALSAASTVSNATDEDIAYIVNESKAVTIESLSEAIEQRQIEAAENSDIVNKRNKAKELVVEVQEGKITNQNQEKFITEKRKLEETRLVMTIEANYKLLKSGFTIETKPLEQVVENLKELEKEHYSTIFKKENVSDQEIQKYKDINLAIEELKTQPAKVLSVQNLDPTVAELQKTGERIKAEYKIINEKYEQLMTKPMAELGDNIEKAFQNVDEILLDLGYDLTEDNKRAVRILGYNSEKINRENIETIKAVDSEVQKAFKQFSPSVTVELIKRGINPLDMKMSELNSTMESIKAEIGSEDKDNFSEYLWKLERSNKITEEERESYIGIYRLISQVNKEGGSAVGVVLGQGSDVTMRNLLGAIRNKNKRGMDYTIDDDFNGINSNINDPIDKQIENGIEENQRKKLRERFEKNQIKESLDILKDTTKLSQSFMEKWEDMPLEQLKDALNKEKNEMAESNKELQQQYFENVSEEYTRVLNTKEDVYSMLEKYDLPLNLVNIEAARELSNPTKLFKKLFGDLKEKTLEKLGKSIKSSEEMADAMEDLADLAEHAMDNMIYEDKTATAEGFKVYRMLGSAFKIMAKQASEESYVIPMETENGIAGVSLKILRGTEDRGLVSIIFDVENKGKIAAKFAANKEKVTGFVATDSNELLDYINSKLPDIVDKIKDISEDVDINAVYSKYVDTSGFDIENAENNNIVTKENELQTKKLYTVAESFIFTFSL